MNIYTYESKNKEEAIKKAISELNTKEILVKNIQEKNSLLKKIIKIEVIKYNDIISYIKELINKILKEMNIEANLEMKRRENIITVTIFSNNNSILIGKDGKNINAFQQLLRQIILFKTNNQIHLTLDVENYREKRNHNLEKMALRIAKEVEKTKIETKLDSMNSYERRIIHNILSSNKNVYTESIGEEPNRCIVIKPREE